MVVFLIYSTGLFVCFVCQFPCLPDCLFLFHTFSKILKRDALSPKSFLKMNSVAISVAKLGGQTFNSISLVRYLLCPRN